MLSLSPLPLMPKSSPAAKIKPQWALALAGRRAQLGMSQEELAARTVLLNQKNISDYENGRVDPRNTTVSRLAALARALNWTLWEMQDAMGIDLGLGRNPNSSLNMIAHRVVESYPMAAAVNPTLPPLDSVVMIASRSDGQPHPPNLRAYVIDDDSMTQANARSLHPGDYVVINLNDRELRHSGIYLIVRGGRAYLRRYKETAIGRAYYADNITHDPIPVDGTQVIGRAYRFWSDRAPDLN